MSGPLATDLFLAFGDDAANVPQLKLKITDPPYTFHHSNTGDSITDQVNFAGGAGDQIILGELVGA